MDANRVLPGKLSWRGVASGDVGLRHWPNKNARTGQMFVRAAFGERY